MNSRNEYTSNGDHEMSDETLKKLVRQAVQDGEAGWTRPSDNALHAYLSGIATEAETLEVQTALSRSEKFRREYLELSDAFAELPESVRGKQQPAAQEGLLTLLWAQLSASLLRPAPALGYLAALVVAAVLLVARGPAHTGGSVASNSRGASIKEVTLKAVLSSGEPTIELRPDELIQFVLPMPSLQANGTFVFEISSEGERRVATRLSPDEAAASWDSNRSCVVMPMQFKASALPPGDVTISFGFEGDPSGNVKRTYRFERLGR